uniref:Poly [ADP-ribose] polymerase n=1 Tax=Poecilia latipinna TaxID=48699 RepID=A0A3B3VWQ8_9TELE
QCSLVVASDLSKLSSNRLRSIQKNQTLVVSLDYLYKRERRSSVSGRVTFNPLLTLMFLTFSLNDLQLLLEEKLNSGELSPDVAAFVEFLWTEAHGCLGNILRVPISGLSLNDVSRTEGLLLQAQRKLKEGNEDEASSLLDEVFFLLPHREPRPQSPTARFLSQKLDLCQLIRDVLNVSEMTMNDPKPSSVGKYRALRCGMEAVPRDNHHKPFWKENNKHLCVSRPVEIQQIMRVSRAVELLRFQSEIGNVTPLLHASSPNNFVGILSRGLLLPRVVVEQLGIKRTDYGRLGSGIYFGDAVSTSLNYAKPSETDGSRLLLVCDVALGVCKDLNEEDKTLTEAPQGYHSVHGVRQTNKTTSEFTNPKLLFKDDEYVVYSLDQVKMKYVVQFRVEGDEQKDFSPDINLTAEPIEPAKNPELVEEDLENVKNPLKRIKAGLLDSSGQRLPLQAVHVKCKLMDLLSQVIIFQKYTNQSSVPIEAKYVFPLDSAAVCGFEAFINGKHVVGEVKEKETARKEYKQAIAKGHGAYLMDQSAPDVFTISVGNLPPGATVLIKVTFVSELVVENGSILFSLPGSVAPWQKSSALNETTQVGEFTLDMSVEMPFEILSLTCITHQVKIKRMDCKAVVSVLPGQVMGSDGFQMSVTLSEVHLPRMWVEKHPDKDSQACMLVFYPNFEFDSSSEGSEVVLLLDTSESMKGESLQLAQKIALQVLKNLKNDVKINIVLFGTGWLSNYLFICIFNSCSSVGGSTELWRPLRALSLLPPSAGVRNLLLLSDGHIQNAAATLQLLRDNAQHSRLFTCGFSSTANRHMLRALAQAGGGAYEFFDSKAKHTWAEKVERQVKRMSSPGCSSVSVKWQQFNPRAPPVQAPKQLNSLFNDCHTLVYGFVPHCTQATLLGDLRGQELQTMVSTTELQKTRGTFLHKLTARALIRDYEDGNLDITEAEHEVSMRVTFDLKSEEGLFVLMSRLEMHDGVIDIPKLIAEEDVDFLPNITWTLPEDKEKVKIFLLILHMLWNCSEVQDFLYAIYMSNQLYKKKFSFLPEYSFWGIRLLLNICHSITAEWDGYWELTVELGKLIKVNMDVFVNVFLKNKGIHSLGERSSLVSVSERWHQVKKAVDWVRWADRQYLYACSRLELGSSWEPSIRRLLSLITEQFHRMNLYSEGDQKDHLSLIWATKVP